jgi:parallel beta-helix repeat protein
LAALPATAQARQAPLTTVECGTVVTTSIRVANDLHDCPGDGLVVGASNITIDLNGHTIDGVPGGPGSGIRLNDFDRVTIRNGTVQEFLVCVQVNDSTGSTVTQIVAADCEHGISLQRTSRSRVVGNTTSGELPGFEASVGIVLVESDRNRIERNKVANEFGILLLTSSDNVVERNVVTGGDVGIALRYGANRNLISRNVVTDQSSSGIDIRYESVENRVERNDVSGSGGDGIFAEPSATYVARNRAYNNALLGINAEGAIDGGGNRAAGNGDPRQCVGVTCRP